MDIGYKEMKELELKRIKFEKISLVVLFSLSGLVSGLILPKVVFLSLITLLLFITSVYFLVHAYLAKNAKKEMIEFEKQMNYVSSKIGKFDSKNVFKMPYGYDVLAKDSLHSVIIKENEIVSIVKKGDSI